jgi:hypothetical protein
MIKEMIVGLSAFCGGIAMSILLGGIPAMYIEKNKFARNFLAVLLGFTIILLLGFCYIIGGAILGTLS